MTNLRNAILLIIFSLLLVANAYSQTYLYGKLGVGKTEIKKFETKDLHFGTSFNPGLFEQYEFGIIHEFPKRISVKLGGGLAKYACRISSPKESQLSIPNYSDTNADLFYISVPVGIQYNPFFNFRLELGFLNNFFSSFSQEGTNYAFQSIDDYDYFKKHLLIPYWEVGYTFFDRLEVGFTDHLYLSNFATYTNWYEQTNGIEPSVFFKYNVWNAYVSYKLRLTKRDK